MGGEHVIAEEAIFSFPNRVLAVDVDGDGDIDAISVWDDLRDDRVARESGGGWFDLGEEDRLRTRLAAARYAENRRISMSDGYLDVVGGEMGLQRHTASGLATERR